MRLEGVDVVEREGGAADPLDESALTSISQPRAAEEGRPGPFPSPL